MKVSLGLHQFDDAANDLWKAFSGPILNLILFSFLFRGIAYDAASKIDVNPVKALIELLTEIKIDSFDLTAVKNATEIAWANVLIVLLVFLVAAVVLDRLVRLLGSLMPGEFSLDENILVFGKKLDPVFSFVCVRSDSDVKRPDGENADAKSPMIPDRLEAWTIARNWLDAQSDMLDYHRRKSGLHNIQRRAEELFSYSKAYMVLIIVFPMSAWLYRIFVLDSSPYERESLLNFESLAWYSLALASFVATIAVQRARYLRASELLVANDMTTFCSLWKLQNDRLSSTSPFEVSPTTAEISGSARDRDIVFIYYGNWERLARRWFGWGRDAVLAL